MPLSTNDVLRVSVRYADPNGNDHINVYYVQADGDITDTDAIILQALEGYLGAAYSEVATNLSNAITPVDLKADVVLFVGGQMEVIRNLGTYPFSPSVAASASAEPMPSGNAALVKFLTGYGKTYGRKFVGMFTEAAQANGILTTGFQSQLADFAAVVLAGITSGLTGGGLVAGVMSKVFAGFVPYTTYDVSDVVAYQRRRRLGTGS